MFNTVFGELPIRYYNNKDYNNTIEALITDTLKLTGSNHYTHSYTLKEEENNLIFDCLAPSINKEQIDISIKNRQLTIKTLDEVKNLPYFTPLNFTIKLKKDINPDNSFARLQNGVLKIIMPVKEDLSGKKILFK